MDHPLPNRPDRSRFQPRTVGLGKIGAGILAILIFVGVSVAYAQSVPFVTLPETVQIDGKTIVLGEIAHISNTDSETARKLGRIVIGSSPLPGEYRQIDADYVGVRLKQSGCDSFRIASADSGNIRIFRASAEVAKEELETCVRDFIFGNMPWDRDSVKIKRIHAPKKITLPAGRVEFRAELPKNTTMKGKFPVGVSLFSNGVFQKKIWVTAEIEALFDVAVTVKPIGRYQPITKEAVRLEKMDVSSVPSNMVTDIQTLIGKRMKRKIDANMVVRSDWVETPPLVRRGDVVVIVAKSENLKITALGKAREKGGKGDRIKVVNLDSDKGIFARVLDSKTVEVSF